MSWKLLYWILGLIVVLPLFNFLLGVHPPRFQTDDDPKRYGLDYESVSFPTSDGLTLRGWFIPTASAARESWRQGGMAWNTCGTVLVGHGYPFDKANILRHALFLHPRFHLLLFDFRYFGESDGGYTTAGLLETRDVQAAIEYVKSRSDVNPESIGALGFSMSASAFITARHPDVYVKSRAKNFGPEVKFRVTLSTAGPSKPAVEQALNETQHDLEQALAAKNISIDEPTEANY